MSELQSKANSSASEYITFRIGSQYFCVDIMSVREIRGWTPATTLPHAPGFVRGVINLRGVVLPVIDLAGMAPGAQRAEIDFGDGRALRFNAHRKLNFPS